MADRRRSGEDWKIEVLCCLDQAGHQPPSVTDIARQIKPTNPNAARSAVHKALVRLKRLGEVEASERSHRSRAITPQGRWRLSRPGLRSAPEPHLELPQRRTSLPVLPRVAGGEPISLEAYADGYESQTLATSLAPDAREYLLEVDGDSMVHVGIEPASGPCSACSATSTGGWGWATGPRR
jgi:SOS-response transcriptional repressor LexA